MLKQKLRGYEQHPTVVYLPCRTVLSDTDRARKFTKILLSKVELYFAVLYHVQNIPQQTAGKIPVVPRVPIFIMQQIVLCLQFNFMVISVFYQQTAKFVAALSCPLLCGICHRNESKNAIQE